MTESVTKTADRKAQRMQKRKQILSVEAAGKHSQALLMQHLATQRLETLGLQKQFEETEIKILSDAQTQYGEEFATRLANAFRNVTGVHSGWMAALAKQMILERAVAILDNVRGPAARLIIAGATLDLLHLSDGQEGEPGQRGS